MKTVIYRKCPFCDDEKFGIEKITNNNLYYLSCLSKNTSSGFYVELNRRGRFSRVEVEDPRAKTKIPLTDRKLFDRLQTPFWKLMGQKAKPQDIQLERFLRWKGWNYGDYRLARDHQAGASEQSGMNQFETHHNKYGTKNAPDPSFTKISSQP